MELGEDQLKDKLIAWNKIYLENLINELRPSGDVLEVGFGLGHAANRIQTYHPKSHTIIESDPEVAKKAKNWAHSKENVFIIENTWQNALSNLGTFDAIFFNDYPLVMGIDMVKRLSAEDATLTADKAQELLSIVEELFSEINVQYSDEQMDDFYQNIGQFHVKELSKFFQILKDKGCISEQQYKNAITKYNINQNHPKNSTQESADPMLTFLEQCLKNHMHKGSRFSSFLNDTISKYEDSQFFDRIITDINIDYHEELVSIEIPEYKFNQALIMVVEKFA